MSLGDAEQTAIAQSPYAALLDMVDTGFLRAKKYSGWLYRLSAAVEPILRLLLDRRVDSAVFVWRSWISFSARTTSGQTSNSMGMPRHSPLTGPPSRGLRLPQPRRQLERWPGRCTSRSIFRTPGSGHSCEAGVQPGTYADPAHQGTDGERELGVPGSHLIANPRREGWL